MPPKTLTVTVSVLDAKPAREFVSYVRAVADEIWPERELYDQTDDYLDAYIGVGDELREALAVFDAQVGGAT